MCLNTKNITKKKNELLVMAEDIGLHIIGKTELWANQYIAYAEIGPTRYVGVMFMRNKIGIMGRENYFIY